MGSRTVQNSIEAKRADMYRVDPDNVVIIGLDTQDGPEHPLWDDRIKLPLNEPLIANIMAIGVKEPVLLQRDGDRVIVIAGRQRVRCAREANKRLAANGCETQLIRAIFERGSDELMLGIAVSENELRQEDTLQSRLRKLELMISMGKSEAECGVYFGVSAQQIKSWLALAEADRSVRKAVDDGKISATAGAKIAKLETKEGQREALAELLQGDGKATAAKAERVARARKQMPQNASDAPAKAFAPPNKRLLKKLATHPNALDDKSAAILKWVLGDIDSDSVELAVEFSKALERVSA